MPFTRADAIEVCKQLFDPRGRCDRRGFLVLAIVLLVLQAIVGLVVKLAGEPMHGTLFMVLNAPLFWIGYMAMLKRLHDSGKSGWWILPAVTLWVVGAFVISMIAAMIVGPAVLAQAVAEKSGLLWLLTALITLPAFGALLWLHASEGEPTANRYGRVPGSLGFARGTEFGPLASKLAKLLSLGSARPA